jgi:hypothetical protein
VGLIPLNFLILHLVDLNGNKFAINLQSIILNKGKDHKIEHKIEHKIDHKIEHKIDHKIDNKSDKKNNQVISVTLPQILSDKIKKFEKFLKSDKNSAPISNTTINSQKLYSEIVNLKNITFKEKGYREINISTMKLLKNIKTIHSENLVKIIFKSILFDLLEEKNKTSLTNKKKPTLLLPEIFSLIPSAPFLPSQSVENMNRISLVLDLDETLIHNLNVKYFIFKNKYLN